MATYGPVARALLHEGCSPEQIAAAVIALEQAREREREERLARLREGARLRQQRYRERLRGLSRRDSGTPPPPPCPPNGFPKDNNQTLSLTPKTTPSSREGAPAQAAPLADDFEASDEDLAFGAAEGLSEEEVSKSERDLKLWAKANGQVRHDWHAILRRFLATDADTKRARSPSPAIPPQNNRNVYVGLEAQKKLAREFYARQADGASRLIAEQGVRSPSPAKVGKPPGVWVKRDSPQGDAWWRHTRRSTGKSAPVDRRGGWRFPSEWPPTEPAPTDRSQHPEELAWQI